MKAGADVNKKDENGCTALMIMARFPVDEDKCMKKYLKSGATINLVDNKNQSALTRHLMKTNCSKEVVMLLFAAGGTIDSTTVEVSDGNGSTSKVPSSITRYLLYNVSLDDDDDDDDDDDILRYSHVIGCRIERTLSWLWCTGH